MLVLNDIISVHNTGITCKDLNEGFCTSIKVVTTLLLPEARRAEGLIIINSEVEDRGINVGFVL